MPVHSRYWISSLRKVFCERAVFDRKSQQGKCTHTSKDASREHGQPTANVPHGPGTSIGDPYFQPLFDERSTAPVPPLSPASFLPIDPYFQPLFGSQQRDDHSAPMATRVRAGLERAIVELLDIKIPENAARQIWERRQRLERLFRAVASPYREELLDRLTTRAKSDALAGRFHYRLHRAERARLHSILRGNVVADYNAHDEWIGSWLHSHIYNRGIRVSPDPVIMGPWMDEISVALRLGDPTFMHLPQEYGELELRWNIDSPDGVSHSRMLRWVAPAQESERTDVTIHAPGNVRVSLDILLDGALLRQVDRVFEVYRGSDHRAALFLGDEALERQMFHVREQLADAGTSADRRLELSRLSSALHFAANERAGIRPPAPAPRGGNCWKNTCTTGSRSADSNGTRSRRSRRNSNAVVSTSLAGSQRKSLSKNGC